MNLLNVLRGIGTGILWAIGCYLFGAIGLFIWTLHFTPLYILGTTGFAGIMRIVCFTSLLAGIISLGEINEI